MFSVEFLNEIREFELNTFLPQFNPGARILEIGGGTGAQALALAKHGFDVVSIDVPGSIYESDRVYPVIQYDGKRIPFASDSFDVAFSSNVLEHIQDLPGLHREIRRVLRSQGYSVHAMPSAAWRFWTSLAHYVEFAQRSAGVVYRMLPRRLNRQTARDMLYWARELVKLSVIYMVPPRHGEFGNVLSELWLFSHRRWSRHLLSNGYQILAREPMGLFYTGHMIFGKRLSLTWRTRMAKYLGSACSLYKVK